jgi:hypothetical protein
MPATNRLRRVPQSQIFPIKSSRFCCSARVRYWHIASFCCVAKFGRYWTNNGQRSVLTLDGYAANDPSATLAVRCSNSFVVGFSPYQCTRLSRYNAVS